MDADSRCRKHSRHWWSRSGLGFGPERHKRNAAILSSHFALDEAPVCAALFLKESLPSHCIFRRTHRGDNILMKTAATPLQRRRLGTPTLFFLAAILGVVFWSFVSSVGFAGSSCMVCHKRTTTLTLLCSSLEYQRHLAHGD